MTKTGYARVSTTDQDLDLQHSKPKAEGREIIRSEEVSGASRDGREKLRTIIEYSNIASLSGNGLLSRLMGAATFNPRRQ